MKKLSQIGLILGLLFIAEALVRIFSLKLPGTIVGLILLTLLLLSGLIKLDWIEEGANLLISILAFLFVPILVESREAFPLLKANLLGLGLIVIIATLVVMIVTMFTTRKINNLMEKRRRD